jgi:hemerythrin-like domain-containing protein
MAADHAVPVATPAPHPILAACELALSAHVHLRTELQALDTELAARTLTPRFTAPWAHFIRSLESHLAVEEEAVFPALAAMAAGQTPETGYEEPLHGMRYELDEMRTIADALRVAAGEAGPLEGRILTLLDELEEHATKEEERLFPMAMELLERWSSGPLPAAADPTSGPAASATPGPVGTVLRRTSGHCHTCLQAVPAEVIRSETEVNLVKHCPTHGSSVQLLSRAPAYWEDLDRYYFKVNKRAYPQRDYILRMTERCNLACPICLAKANTEDTPTSTSPASRPCSPSGAASRSISWPPSPRCGKTSPTGSARSRPPGTSPRSTRTGSSSPTTTTPARSRTRGWTRSSSSSTALTRSPTRPSAGGRS